MYLTLCSVPGMADICQLCVYCACVDVLTDFHVKSFGWNVHLPIVILVCKQHTIVNVLQTYSVSLKGGAFQPRRLEGNCRPHMTCLNIRNWWLSETIETLDVKYAGYKTIFFSFFKCSE